MTILSKTSLLRVADAFLAARDGLREVTLSYWIFGDTKKLSALRGDADITVGRFNAAMTWFAQHWPEGVEAPEVLRAYLAAKPVEAPLPPSAEDAA